MPIHFWGCNHTRRGESLAMKAPTCRPAAAHSTPRGSLFVGASKKSSEGQPLRKRHRPSASPSLFCPFGCAANSSSSPSHVVIHAGFLRIPDRRSPPAVLCTVNKPRTAITYRSWRAPGRAEPTGRETADDEQSYPQHLWEGGGNGCLYFSSNAAGKGKRHKRPCAVAVEVHRCIL